MAEIKEKTIKTAHLTPENISAYISWAYDSLRETLEALRILNGYKVLSHACIGALFLTLIPDYKEFDRLHWIRNRINYYGQKIEYKQGKELITQIFTMKNKIIQEHLHRRYS